MGRFHKAKNRNFLKGLTHNFSKKNSKKFLFVFAKISLKIEFLNDLEYKNGNFS